MEEISLEEILPQTSSYLGTSNHNVNLERFSKGGVELLSSLYHQDNVNSAQPAIPDLTMNQIQLPTSSHTFNDYNQFGTTSNNFQVSNTTVRDQLITRLLNNIQLKDAVKAFPFDQWSLHQQNVGGIDAPIDSQCANRLMNGKLLPSDYVCHLCSIRGHFIRDCPLVSD